MLHIFFTLIKMFTDLLPYMEESAFLIYSGFSFNMPIVSSNCVNGLSFHQGFSFKCSDAADMNRKHFKNPFKLAHWWKTGTEVPIHLS